MNVYTDYDILSATIGETTGIFAAIVGALATYFLVLIIITIIYAIAWYKIFEKNGLPAWKIFVPVYNSWLMLTIASLPGWLILIPYINYFALIYAFYKIGKNDNRSTTMAILMALLPFIFVPIFAFTYNKNVGKSVVGSDVNNMNQNIDRIQTDMSGTSFNNVINNNGVVNNQSPNVEPAYQNDFTNVQNQNISDIPVVGFDNLNQQKVPAAFCTNCGQSNISNSAFCTNCGNKL